jgi:transmembrane sensor
MALNTTAMTNKYSSFLLEDFIVDEAFISWVKYPTTESNLFWGNFIASQPEKATTISNARVAVLSLVEASKQTTYYNDSPEIWEEIKTGVAQKNKSHLFSKYSIRWVAAAMLLIGAGTWWVIQQQSERAYTYKVAISKTEQQLEEIINTSGEDLSFELSDQSTVILKPNSRFSHSDFSNGVLREVYLSGEAFFDITKNPKKPFIVYANGLITKVLGTSFSIKAFEGDKNVTVNVSTGKVSVYAQKYTDNSDPETNGFILIPNQKVVFEKEGERLTRALVEEPALLLTKKELQQFNFRNTPVDVIFASLEKAYGVKIINDKDALTNCRLTTSLTSETLFEKLDIICGAIEATYKVVDAQIIISSDGCN